MKKYISNNENETNIIAEEFAKTLHGGDIVFLIGELGAGKTLFSKQIAKFLGVKQDVVSPTFTLLNIYNGQKYTLCHFDLYRIDDKIELEMLNFDEYFYDKSSICLIEWPQILQDYSFDCVTIVKINKMEDGKREILIGEPNEHIEY